MKTDILINKCQIIERCIHRIYEEYDDNVANLNHYTKQDSIILNIQRACEACIDIAMHIISEKALGVPQSSRDAFDILLKSGIIQDDMSLRLKAMVGFRNIVVHDYQQVNLNIIKNIIEHHIEDFIQFKLLVLMLD